MSKVDLGQRYEPRRELGSGGAGRVFMVHDRHLGRDLALKLLHRGRRDPQELEAFKDEFSLLAGMEHPGIARAFDFGYLGDRPYFTSEFVAGTPLDTWSLRARKDPSEVLSRILDVAEALAFLHRNAILHLDVKPGNIIVPAEGSRGRAVLVDFGLFRRAFPAPPRSLKGTLRYMAPEYFRGERLGAFTDVYALGVTLYWVLTRRFPRHSPPGRPRIGSGFRLEPSAPRRIGGRTPPELEGIILKCLAMDPASRYPSAVELLEALRAIERGAAPRGNAPASTIGTIGRRSEIERIESFLSALALEKGPDTPEPRQIALVLTGPPGMGQSHLLREAKVRAQTRGIQVSLETGYAGQTTSPGSVLRILGVPSAAADARAARRWRDFLSGLERRRSAREHATVEGERRLRRAAEMALVVKAVRRPTIVAVDGLQFWDEISTSLVVDLVRHIGDMDRAKRPPLRLALGYREEGPCAPLLRELTAYLLAAPRAEIITLKPLDVFETLELHRKLRGGDAGDEGGFEYFQVTRGCPARIHARARGEVEEESPGGTRTREGISTAVPRLGNTERLVLCILVLLERPAAFGEISRISGLRRRALKKCLSRLDEARLVAETHGHGAERSWLPGPAAGERLGRLDPDARSRLHLRIARDLCRRMRLRHDVRIVEAVQHFAAAGSKGNVVRYGLPAAQYLKATLQSRASLRLYRTVLESLPPSRVASRVNVAVAIAELQAALGDLDDGIAILRDLLTRSRDLARPLKGRVLLWLATLHSRRGEYRRADSLFGDALRSVKGSDLELESRLFFLNEHASLKGMLGRHGDAIALCDQGLRLAARSRKTRVRELVLYLSATRAAVAQRTFEHEAAIKDFEAALEMAEALGSQASQAVLLNNLGIAYNNTDRYADAIRAFREAERINSRLDEGPSLLSIHGNLAVLEAKTGSFREMERSLEAAERLAPASGGCRATLILEHSRGLCRLYQGRHASARPHLEASRRLAEEAGDRLLAAFDAVHRLETLIFTGRYAEALAESERLSDDGYPRHLRRMVRARQAFLCSILADGESVERLRGELEATPESRPPSFLEAWNQLFLGWASLLSDPRGESGPRHLSRARDFLIDHGLRPAAALARWIRAEAHFLRGEMEEAMVHLDPDPGVGNGLCSCLDPLLRARILLQSGSMSARCADLLAEADSRLAQSPMPEWSLRVRALRIRLQASPAADMAQIDEERRRLTRGLPDAACKRYLESAWWRIWTQGTVRRKSTRSLRSEPGPRAGSRTEDSPVTRAAPVVESARSALVAQSRSMRRLIADLDRIRASDLPVLVSGETGTGKETVARVLHGESRRASAPFVVVDCATLPEELLETELFGARMGAFSGMAGDRPGLLAAADRGTVFLDEITFASLGVQAKLLRVLSGHGFRPLGSEVVTPADVRFLFSTSRDLDEEVRENRFRPELLHRIRVLEVRVPPLRERIEDLPGLVEMLLRDENRAPPRLENGVLERLSGFPWPGNVRELRNLLARLCVENGRSISVEALERSGLQPKTSTIFPSNLLATKPLGMLKDSLERDYILYHLQRLRFDTRKVSEFLGLEMQRFYRLCRRLGIRLWERRRIGRTGKDR